MTPTEKHRETADDVYDDLARGHNLDGISRHDIVLAFAFAIARAEREGMKRAAEIAREHTPIALDNCDIRISATLEVVARAILSETGEG